MRYGVGHGNRIEVIEAEELIFRVNKEGQLIFFDQHGLAKPGWKFEAGDWSFIRVIDTVVKVGGVITQDPVAEFHRQRGCCDGTDPAGCFRKRQEAEEAERATSRDEKRDGRKPWNEFDGTEPMR